MKTSLSPSNQAAYSQHLAQIGAEVAQRYPGESSRRQPVHTVYGGAHLFKADTTRKLGDIAIRSMQTYAPTPEVFAAALGLAGDASFHASIHGRVIAKLRREPIEDFRIDFEDGYGNRAHDEEDACAAQVAAELVRGLDGGTLPPFIGIRIKPLSMELAPRGIRTLDIVLSTVLGATGGLPDNFVVTLPKVQTTEQVSALVDTLARLEQEHGLDPDTLQLELMIETTQSIVAPDGSCMLPLLAEAARGRCVAAHFGVYDYTASCQVTAQHQEMTHPACDFARHMMQVAFGGTGIRLSDGATNVMPVGERSAVHDAWRLHYEHVRHSLRHAYYQGWDLHPAQLPTRYAAVYAFFHESLEPASSRLRHFMDVAAQATLHGDVFDDAATGQGLLNFFLRGLNCGAIAEDEATATGLTIDELRSRSFVRILAGR